MPIGNGVFFSILAILPVPFLAAIYAMLFGGSFSESIYTLLFWGFWVVIVTFGASVLIGTPIYLLLKHISREDWWLFSSSGAIVGVLLGFWSFPYGDLIFIGTAFGLLGAYSATAYWYGISKYNANK